MTAKEYFKKHLSGEPLHQDVVIEAMIEFAKYHVKQALKAALEEAPTGSSTDIPSYEDMEDAILNAYPLENIK